MKINRIYKTSYACPTQWEGITDDNRKVYIRYRWGYLSVRIGKVDDMSEFAAVGGEEILGCSFGDAYDGCLEYSELKKLTEEVLELPEIDNEDSISV